MTLYDPNSKPIMTHSVNTNHILNDAGSLLGNQSAGVVRLHYEYIPNYSFNVNGTRVVLKEKDLLDLVTLYDDVQKLSEEFPAVQELYTQLITLVKLHKE